MEKRNQQIPPREKPGADPDSLWRATIYLNQSISERPHSTTYSLSSEKKKKWIKTCIYTFIIWSIAQHACFFFKQNQHKLPDCNSMVIYKCWPRCKPWQIPPAHIYAWHIEQPASSMHQNPLRILSFILQQDQCSMCVNCCHLSGKVCQRGSTRCNKCEWKYCTINLGHDVACCRKHFLTYRGTFFATVMRKKLPGSQQQHSHSGSTIETFSHGELFGF